MEPIKIVFACTTLSLDSTLIRNFDIINDKIQSCFQRLVDDITSEKWKYIPKLAYIIFSGRVSPANQKSIEILNSQGYEIFTNNVIQSDVIDYLETSGLIADMIVSCQCSDIVSFINSERQHVGENIVIQNYNTFYSHLTDYGFFLNFGYNQNSIENNGIFENVNKFYSLISIIHFIDLFVLLEMFRMDFKNIEEGVYQKVGTQVRISSERQSIDKIYNSIEENMANIFQKYDMNQSIEWIITQLIHYLYHFPEYYELNMRPIYNSIQRTIRKITS